MSATNCEVCHHPVGTQYMLMVKGQPTGDAVEDTLRRAATPIDGQYYPRINQRQVAGLICCECLEAAERLHEVRPQLFERYRDSSVALAAAQEIFNFLVPAPPLVATQKG